MNRIPTTLLTIAALCACGHSSFAKDGIPLDGVNQTPLKIHVEKAFTNIQVARPVLIANANDGTNRLFFGSQLGTIFVVPNKNDVEDAKEFLNIESRVTYSDQQNEEGLLGLAFHPKYKENGEFFVYYTSKKEPLLSTISRFRVSKDDPSKALADSEEILITIKQPYWNHNGGTLAFGPDGYLYVGLGDGGFRNDPLLSGQDLSKLLGKILRIDVDHKDPGMAYAIPKDNPFVGVKEAKPEIFALGFRNIWRMSFDRKNGDFWVADVGQDLWEEINVVTKGGNYGWSVREAAHPFTQKKGDDVSKLIDPIFEYPHTDDWGKSITGGVVYRGKKVPSLVGYYVYADYITGKMWALKYDPASKKVVENRPIPFPARTPIVTYGEDEDGEVLFGSTSGDGIIFRFVEG